MAQGTDLEHDAQQDTSAKDSKPCCPPHIRARAVKPHHREAAPARGPRSKVSTTPLHAAGFEPPFLFDADSSRTSTQIANMLNVSGSGGARTWAGGGL